MHYRNSAYILFFSTFKKMQLNESALHTYNGHLVSFSGKRINVKGYVWLRTTLRTEPKRKMIGIQYLIIDCLTPYHIIIGQPSLNTLGAIIYKISSYFNLSTVFLIFHSFVSVLESYPILSFLIFQLLFKFFINLLMKIYLFLLYIKPTPSLQERRQ